MLQNLTLHLLVLVHPGSSQLITVFLMLFSHNFLPGPQPFGVWNSVFSATGKSIAELIWFDSYHEDAARVEQHLLNHCCTFVSFTLKKEKSQMQMRWEGSSGTRGRWLSRARQVEIAKIRDLCCGSGLLWSNVTEGVNVTERNGSSYAGRRTVSSAQGLLLVAFQLG